jgi:hypothetical protein
MSGGRMPPRQPPGWRRYNFERCAFIAGEPPALQSERIETLNKLNELGQLAKPGQLAELGDVTYT